MPSIPALSTRQLGVQSQLPDALNLHLWSLLDGMLEASPAVVHVARTTAITARSLFLLPRNLYTLHTRKHHIPKVPFLPYTQEAAHHLILPRQQQGTIAIPTTYDGIDAGPAPAAVVGITLGSVAGFLLLVWLLYFLSNNSSNQIRGDEEIVVRRGPSTRRTRSRRSSPRREMRSRSPRRIIVEERRTTREVSAPAPPPPPMSMPPPPAPPPAPRSIIVEERREVERERRVEGDDLVEVIEEHSDLSSVRPPPRRERRSRRESGGYRSVDPNLYAGGDYPQHKVRRYSRDSSRG